jgi:hypothetical protein
MALVLRLAADLLDRDQPGLLEGALEVGDETAACVAGPLFSYSPHIRNNRRWTARPYAGS